MAKRDRTTHSDKIERWIKAGKGQGRGADYSPWLTVQDVPSRGLATRMRGHKTKRVHHLLSKLETDFFCVLEFSPTVVDIREQFPLLPLEETLTIAETCGIRHPTDPKSREPVVMTTDFVITCLHQEKPAETARTLKHGRDLESKRTIEKLEIERRYWLSHQVDWGIVTEKELQPVVVQNCRLLRDYLEPIKNHLQSQESETIEAFLSEKIQQKDLALRTLALECDRQLGFAHGTSLAVAYHLMACRRWLIDWHQPIDPGKPLALLSALPQQPGGVA